MVSKRKLSVEGVDSEELSDILLKLVKKAKLLDTSAKTEISANGAATKAPLVSLDNSDQESDVIDQSSDSGSSSGSDSRSDSDSESSEDEVEMATRAKDKQAQREKEKAASQAAVDAWMLKANGTPSPTNKSRKGDRSGEKETSGSKAFKRVDNNVWSKEIVDGLEDNTYEKVFGEGGYGARASAKLLQVQGKKFQHEKTKAKRSSSYKGGVIDASAKSKSFKYEDSD